MPFKETCAMEERIALFREYDSGAFTVGALCARYGISCQTFYAWKRRRADGGERWFEDKSHAAGSCPHATDGRLVERVIALRRKYPHFGPKKIKAVLENETRELGNGVMWPAASTIGDILKRAGLVEAKRRRRRAIPQGEIVAPATAPNEEWAMDFKGWFRTLDGKRTDPLTITDTVSRYLIELRIAEQTLAGVRGALERVFQEIGLPEAIRCDNGMPFGSRSGLSAYGGSSSASSRATSRRPRPSTMAGTSACIGH
jgi:transposase-like protein